jgi:hypothetical protein
MTKSTDKHNAASSLLGYLYQCRQALLLAVEETRSAPGLSISIERFDDVSFEQDGIPLAAIQTKHHTKAGNLTNSSVDLWKTLRIWADQVRADAQLPFERRFVIVTTGTAPAGSIAASLRAGTAKEVRAAALKTLQSVAATSKNKETVDGRDAFSALSSESQSNLVSAIYIFDNAPDITNSRSEIEDRLRFAAPATHIPALVDHLEGWWFASIIRCLTGAEALGISLLALRQKIDELATAFRQGDLLLSPETEAVPAPTDIASDDRLFVKQLHCVGLSARSVEGAIRDFYRATTQRSAWARENVLLDGETQRYDEGLCDRWQREHEARIEGADLSDDQGKLKFGREFFHWANREQMPFRNRHEAWLCTGSYQILADALRVGWHPEYRVLFGSSGGE